jgi:hypothetical protein
MRKPLAASGLVLSVAGFITFIALGIGAWIAKREADQQLNAAVAKAHQAGDVAERVIVLIREVLSRAKASLTAARAETLPKADVSDPMVRLAMWKAKRELPGEVEKARDAVGVASEAVIVAESFFDVFVEHKPDETALGVKAGDIHAARAQLDSAAADLRNARTVLGVPIGPASAEQYSQVEQALATATDVTNRVDEALKDAQRKVDALKSSADRWSLRLAIAGSALAALAALGQVFLFRASRRALRGAACSPSP